MDKIPSTSSSGKTEGPESSGKDTQLHSDTGSNSPPLSPPEKQAVTFAKAALIFHDNLEKHRQRSAGAQSSPPPGKPQPKAEVQEASDESKNVPNVNKNARQIRLLRMIQHTLTSLLSLTIAILQGRAYALYNQTKNTPGAWPAHPSLLPTLMLFGIAIAALTFDICALIAYIFPGTDFARRAYSIAIKTHNIVAASKTVSWALVAIVCRASFTQGNASGQNTDLWSWCCSGKSVQDTMSVCYMGTVAWVLSLFQIAIEILGVFINVLIGQKNGDDGKQDANGAQNPDPEKKALISNDDDQLDQWGDEMNTDLEGASPDLKGGSGKS